MSDLIGQLEVIAPPKRVAMVRSMLASFDVDVDPARFLPRVVKVVFGPVIKVPGGGRAAGDTQSATLTRIRHGVADAPNLSNATTQYTVCHEVFGHARLLQRPLTDDQKRRCLELLDGPPLPPFTDPDEVWRKVEGEEDYWLRPYECVIDAVVEALTALESPFQKQYRRRIRDLAALKAIWLESPVSPPPPPEPPPPPLPPPPDLSLRVAALEDRLKEIGADLDSLTPQVQTIREKARIG